MRLVPKVRNKLLTFLKLSVAFGAVFFICSKVLKQEIEWANLDWPHQFSIWLLLIIFLMLFNWGLEAFRWMKALALSEDLSFSQSTKAVLRGLALNWVLPMTSGDFFSRLSQANDKYQATSALVFSRGIMLFLTLIYGFISAQFYFRENLIYNNVLKYEWLGFLVLLVLIGWFFRRKASNFMVYFRGLSASRVLIVILLSIIRYTVFTIQLFIMLKIFMPHLSSEILLYGIGWIFFFRSVLPGILGGIGVREASGIVFFASFDQQGVVIVPIFLIWLINTVIPSIAGIYYIWTFSGIKTRTVSTTAV
ncbi:MAG: lysylphosphatidylglycerol synthase domain-containing protein [Bacteroidota bacterium]